MEDREQILNRILSNIPDRYDKSKGLFPYDFSKATTIEFEKKNEEIQEVANKLDVENLEGGELERYVYQHTGTVIRKPATKATTMVIISGQESARINKGDLVGADTVSFISTEDKTIDATGQAEVKVECEESGTVGNVPAGAIKYFPVSIPGLVDVYNPNEVMNGYDAESDTELRNRYYEKLQRPAKAGNKYHYEQWAKEVVGVGGVRAVPRWRASETTAIVKSILDTILSNGIYTDEEVQSIINAAIECALSIKVVIIDNNGKPASEELVNNTFNHIESQRPFGAYPTVISAEPVMVDISATLILAEGYTDLQVKENISKNIAEYLKSIAFKKDYVSYAKIGSIILNTEGVIDRSNLKVNGGIANIPIGNENEEVAIMGVIE